MVKRSPRRKTMVFSPSTGVLQGYATMPPAVQQNVIAQKRKSLTSSNNALLKAVMKDINDVKKKIASSKSPYHADIHRRLDRIKRRLSGKKAVMFAPQ